MTGRILWGAGWVVLAVVAAWAFFGSRSETAPPITAADSVVEHRSADTLEQDSAHPLQTAATAAALPSESAGGVAAVLALGRTGLSADELFERAQADPELASEMSRIVLLCSTLSGKTPTPGSRWAGSGWATYRERCDHFPWQALRNKDFIGETPRVKGVLDDVFELPEDSPERKALAAEVLASEQELRDLQYATALYFDAERLWALTDAHDLRGGLRLGDHNFQIDASLYIGCQFSSRGCAWDSSLVLMECLVTGGCSPGMSMPQIIALRRSPLEMELLRLAAEEVAQLRRRP